VTRHLKYAGVNADALHSDKSQKDRQRTLANFKEGRTKILVASDIAARGLDVDDISHVINFDMPEEAEIYVHRIGRTARAGATGQAWSLCAITERVYLDAIEKLIHKTIEPVTDHPYAPAERTAVEARRKLPRRILGSRRRMRVR